jgi:phage shock protein A
MGIPGLPGGDGGGRLATAAGNTAEASAFENLARVALKRQIDFEDDAKDLQPTITQQNEVVNKLKAGLEDMRAKLDELGASTTS